MIEIFYIWAAQYSRHLGNIASDIEEVNLKFRHFNYSNLNVNSSMQLVAIILIRENIDSNVERQST